MAPRKKPADSSTPDLFARAGDSDRERHAPLAWKMRPRRLDDVVGQDHLVGPGGLFHAMLATRTLKSAVMVGPTGTGKTTVARILSEASGYRLVELSGVSTGTGEIRDAISCAQTNWNHHGSGTVLFLDEIHRLTRVQQDVLLPVVENGTLVVLGATTENPWVTLSSALLSRMVVAHFRPLDPAEVLEILRRALHRLDVEAEPGVLERVAHGAGGDARLALGVLEDALLMVGANAADRLSQEVVNQVWPDAAHFHDRHGDRHYDLISAFIKSMRGSDPDAALYWLGRMLAGGEDPRFIVRRLLVHAAEDVGLADPRALLVAHAAWQALESVGLPEARIPIAMATIYIATAPKSNAVVAALGRLDETIQQHPDAPVPSSIRDRHSAHGDEADAYRYPHSAPDHFLPDPHLPEKLQECILYEPSAEGEEGQIAARLKNWRHRRTAFVRGSTN